MDNFEVILDALAEKIIKLENDNYIKDIQLEALKKKLAEAEYHLDPTPANAKKLEIR